MPTTCLEFQEYMEIFQADISDLASGKREKSNVGSMDCIFFNLEDSLALISSEHAGKGPDLGSVAYYSAVPLWWQVQSWCMVS